MSEGKGATAMDWQTRAAVADVSARIHVLYNFLLARGHEHHAATHKFWQSIGYAVGYAEACLVRGDVIDATRQLELLRDKAARWKTHPDFPADR